MNKALLLVDIQNDFCPGGALAVPEGDQIIPVVNALRPLFAIVIATRDYHPPGHISFASRHGQPLFTTIETEHGPQTLWPDHCVIDSAGAALHEKLDPTVITEIVDKGTNPEIDSYSGFFDNGRLQETRLHSLLRKLSVSELYVCGLATDYCVMFTALDALELGYKVTVVTDGCRGVNLQEGDSERALARIADKGGRNVTSADVIRELEGGK